MNSKSLRVLFILLAVLGGLAYLSQRGETPKQQGLNAGDTLLKAFDPNAVTQFELRNTEGTNRLKRVDGIWVSDSLYAYPADFENLAQHIRGLIDLKAGQVIRNGSQYLDEFGLSPEASQLVLLDDNGKILAQLTLGNERASAGNANPYGGRASERYVLTTSGDVALVEGELNRLPSKPEDWITKTLLNVPSTDLTEITVSSNKTSYTLNITSNTTYHLAKLKRKQEINTENAARLSRALQYLNFNTLVDPNTPDSELGLDAATTYSALTSDGFTYTLSLGKEQAEGRPLRLAVTYTAPEGISDEDTQAAEEKLSELTGHAKWTYLISPHGAEAMTLSRKLLIQKKE